MAKYSKKKRSPSSSWRRTPQLPKQLDSTNIQTQKSNKVSSSQRRFQAQLTQGYQKNDRIGKKFATTQIEAGSSVGNNPKEGFKEIKAQKKRRQSREAENRLNRPIQISSNPNRGQSRGKSTKWIGQNKPLKKRGQKTTSSLPRDSKNSNLSNRQKKGLAFKRDGQKIKKAKQTEAKQYENEVLNILEAAGIKKTKEFIRDRPRNLQNSSDFIKLYVAANQHKPLCKSQSIMEQVQKFKKSKEKKKQKKTPDLVTSIQTRQLIEKLEAAQFLVDKTYYEQDKEQDKEKKEKDTIIQITSNAQDLILKIVKMEIYLSVNGPPNQNTVAVFICNGITNSEYIHRISHFAWLQEIKQGFGTRFAYNKSLISNLERKKNLIFCYYPNSKITQMKKFWTEEVTKQKDEEIKKRENQMVKFDKKLKKKVKQLKRQNFILKVQEYSRRNRRLKEQFQKDFHTYLLDLRVVPKIKPTQVGRISQQLIKQFNESWMTKHKKMKKMLRPQDSDSSDDYQDNDQDDDDEEEDDSEEENDKEEEDDEEEEEEDNDDDDDYDDDDDDDDDDESKDYGIISVKKKR